MPSSSQDSAQAPSFLTLPAEIRNIIYVHLFSAPNRDVWIKRGALTDRIHHDKRQEMTLHAPRPDLFPSILLTCRQTFLETQYTFYNAYNFCLDRAWMIEMFTDKIGSENAACIRCIFLGAWKRSWIEKDGTTSQLERVLMTLPALASFEVAFGHSSTGATMEDEVRESGDDLHHFLVTLLRRHPTLTKLKAVLSKNRPATTMSLHFWPCDWHRWGHESQYDLSTPDPNYVHFLILYQEGSEFEKLRENRLYAEVGASVPKHEDGRGKLAMILDCNF